MKRNISLVAMSCVLMLLFSCSSSMKVHVDALNMPAFKATYLYKAEDLDKKKVAILGLLSNEFSNKVDQLLTAISNFIDTSGTVPDVDIKFLKNDFEKRVASSMSAIKASANNTLNSIEKFKTNPGDTTQFEFEKNYTGLKMSFERLQGVIEDVKIIDSATQVNFPVSVVLHLNELQNTIEFINSTFGESIVNDPLSSVIAALPEQYWSKNKKSVNLSYLSGDMDAKNTGDIKKYDKKYPNRFNSTTARTFFGNSDIAIKMTTPGEFIVKGVRVDADEAIRNSFKVVSQGIKYMAYAAGVPVVNAADGSKKSISPFLDSLQQKELDLTSLKSSYSKATDAFLAVVIEAAADLKATKPKNGQSADDIKAAALNRIKIAYAVYKNSLSN